MITERITVTKAIANKIKFTAQPIQWHLSTTTYDRCPRCGAGLGLLSRDRRACMGDECPGGTVWECSLTPNGFLQEMINRDEPAEWIDRRTRTRCGTCGKTGHNARRCEEGRR